MLAIYALAAGGVFGKGLGIQGFAAVTAVRIGSALDQA